VPLPSSGDDGVGWLDEPSGTARTTSETAQPRTPAFWTRAEGRRERCRMEVTDGVADASTVTGHAKDRVLLPERVELEPARLEMIADGEWAGHQEGRSVP
jgi:hypothetical protein